MAHQLGLANGLGIPGLLGFPAALGGMVTATKKQRMEDGQAVVSNSFDENLSDDEDQMMKGKGGGKLTSEAKRSQHCEVEKRRRERMNRYMSELAQMIPACNAVPRRLDKLSILKMAVDHMKNLRGDPHTASDYKPGFLTDDELKQLVVEAANGFMIIIECSQARVLFVSDAIVDVLHESEDEWIGSCFYDLLHPKDIQKVKEQLACFDVEEALKTCVKQNVSSSPLVMHSQSMNGLRRSFLCRVKRAVTSQQTSVNGTPDTQQLELAGRDYNRSEDVIKLLQSTQQSTPYQYAVLHCTGFIRNLTSTERQTLRVEESSSGACLVAVARLQHFGESVPRAAMETSENEFVARVGVDGRFTYVDPRVAGVLGYLPQDLMGQVSYEYYHPEDIQKMVQLHHDAMKRRTPMPTVQYRALSKNQKWVWLAMKAFSFINPFSQQVEYVVCTNVAMRSPAENDQPPVAMQQSTATPSQDTDKQERIERYVRMTISNQVEQQLLNQDQSRPAITQAGEAEDDPLAALLPELTGELSQAGLASLSVPMQAATTLPQQLQGVDSISVLLSASSQPQLAQHQEVQLHGAISTTAPVSSATPMVTSSAGLSSTAHATPVTQGSMGAVITVPASTTLEENAATAQQFLEEYNRLNAVPPQRKDMNYNFPPGLFSTEVDLEGSQQAYRNLLVDLDRPEEFQRLFDQVEADPLHPRNVFQDIDFDVFD